MALKHVIHVMNAGKLRYHDGLRLQERIINMIRTNQDTSGYLIITEHNPVYTIGIRRKDYNMDYEKKLQSLGAEFFRTSRGGLVTFHGPGQLVVYPILNLKKFEPSIRWYIYQLEQTVIDTCRQFEVIANTSPDTGVWVSDKKICAIGIRASQYVTSHGLALNCETDLNWFKHIIPCGISDKGVTSLSKECEKTITIDEAHPHLVDAFSKRFNCDIEYFPIDELRDSKT